MKLVLFTFDYELFLGERSGKVTDCIIKPTEALLKEFATYGFKGIFFVDTCYLLRLQETAKTHEAAKHDYDLIVKQLGDMVRKGHEIHPHVHPHWLDAVYLPELNEWSQTNLRYYQFSALPAEQQQDLFQASVNILTPIISAAGSAQKTDSYRAGGWSIQPFGSFKPHFIQSAIKHEWSVIPGKYHFSTAHTFDFRNAPYTDTYRFTDDVCVNDDKGAFKQWTISCFDLDGFSKWIYFKVNGIYSRLNKKRTNSGSTVNSQVAEEGDIYCKPGGLRRVASFEQLNPYISRKYIGYIKERDYYQFISHPKLISEADFKILRSLLKQISRIKGVETDFRKAIA